MRHDESVPGDQNQCQNQIWWSFSLLIDSRSDMWITHCFDDVTIKSRGNQTQVLGSAEDISAVYGLITGLRDMGTTILYLEIKKRKKR